MAKRPPPLPKPFQWKIPKPSIYKSERRLYPLNAETGKQDFYVQGERASENEYWFAQALDQLRAGGSILDYKFQPSYVSGYNIPGEIRLDFMVIVPPNLPIQIDGSWVHHSAEEQERSRLQDRRLDGWLAGTGAFPTIRIPTDPYVMSPEFALMAARMAIRGERFV